MREGIVVGSVTSTVKHPCLAGKKLLLVQVIDADGVARGRPQLVVDFTGAGMHDRVLLNWDGIGSQEMFGDPHVPQRAWLCGIIDENSDGNRIE